MGEFILIVTILTADKISENYDYFDSKRECETIARMIEQEAYNLGREQGFEVSTKCKRN